MNHLFTIGHSNYSIDFFLELLHAHSITALADIRSVPYSKFNPQYNRESLQKSLEEHHIKYLWFGKEFGAMQSGNDVFENGNVSFKKVRKSKNFLLGLKRLRIGLEKHYTIALMCAESNPLDCHRFYMVSMELAEHGFSLSHILKDKSIKSQDELCAELITLNVKHIPKPTMYESDLSVKEKVDLICELKNKQMTSST